MKTLFAGIALGIALACGIPNQVEKMNFTEYTVPVEAVDGDEVFVILDDNLYSFYGTGFQLDQMIKIRMDERDHAIVDAWSF